MGDRSGVATIQKRIIHMGEHGIAIVTDDVDSIDLVGGWKRVGIRIINDVGSQNLIICLTVESPPPISSKIRQIGVDEVGNLFDIVWSRQADQLVEIQF